MQLATSQQPAATTEVQVQARQQRVIVSRQDSFHLLHKSSVVVVIFIPILVPVIIWAVIFDISRDLGYIPLSSQPS